MRSHGAKLGALRTSLFIMLREAGGLLVVLVTWFVTLRVDPRKTAGCMSRGFLAGDSRLVRLAVEAFLRSLSMRLGLEAFEMESRMR